MKRLATLIENKARWIVFGAIAVLGLAVWISTDLRVDQNFRRLLPQDSVTVERLLATDDTIGNQSDLVLAIRSPSREANIEFGTALAEAMRKRTDLDLRYVLFHQDPAFFEKNALLYASLSDLLDLRDRVRRRIKKAVKKTLDLGLSDDTPATGEGGGEKAEDGLNVDTLKERYELDTRLREYMEADDGRVIIIKARPDRSNSDLAYARKLTTAIETMAADLQPTKYHPDLNVVVEGSYAENTRRARSLQSSILQGTIACIVVLLLSIAVFFRAFRAVIWILVPLLVSVTCALAFAQVAFGHLNLVSAFIFAILLGLGIDFGVHMLSRYRDERARGLDRHGAFAHALSTTGLSTSAGALSTAGCFAVLSVSDFQGFAQFGVVAAVGIVFALIAALVALPALVRTMGGKGDHTFGSRVDRTVVEAAAGPKTRPTKSLIVLAVALALGGYGVLHAGDLAFEYDLSKLGPQRVAKKTAKGEKPAAPVKSALPAEAAGPRSAPGIILTKSLEETAAVHRQLATLLAEQEAEKKTGEKVDMVVEPEVQAMGKFAKLKEKASRVGTADPQARELLGRYSPARREVMRRRISEVFSIYDYVPDGQDDKLTVIRDIKKRVDRKRRIFEGKDKEDVDEWYPYLEVTDTFGVDELPGWIKARMTDRRGELGCFVIFWAYGKKADYVNAKEIREAFFDLETQGESAPSAAEYYVLPAIIDTIRNDGPTVTALAIVVMFIAAWLLVGGLEGPIVVFSVVGLALFWLGAIMYVLGWKADMFNIIAIPLLVGMGQDDALHVYHRYKEGGPGSIGKAVRETGSAVFLTTWSTSVGFAGIFFSNHRGLLSLAKISVAGIVLCWLSAVVVLPAALRVMEWRRAVSASTG